MTVTVEQRDESGVVVKVPKVRPEQLMSIGAPGLSKLFGSEPRYRAESDFSPSGHLYYVLGERRSVWQAASGRLARDPNTHAIYGNPWAAVIAAEHSPFFFSDAREDRELGGATRSGDGCDVGWFGD